MSLDDTFSVALLHMDGTDGSTTFTDESGKVWTARGNAQIDTGQSVFGGASGQSDGTGDTVDTPDHADWQLDGGSNSNAWTIDFRLRFNGDPGTGSFGFIQQYVDASNFWELYLNNNNLIFNVASGGSNIITISNAWNPATATWYHAALVKDGTNGYMAFIDGTQIGSTQIDTSTIPDFAAILEIWKRGTTANLNGWMDELRISKGIARWTANFTPPAAAYAPATSNFFMFMN